MTGHLLSALALTYANTGDGDAKSRGQYLVSQLAAFQAKDASRGFHAGGYLSAFPEGYFDILEQGKSIWAPYYMIHKYLAGMIDQYQLAGDDQALDVAKKLADWVDWRTHRLSYGQMQMILQTEFGGLAEALANLYTITGQERYLAAAQRFYHAIVLDPLAEGMDNLPGLQANVTTPKIIACLRMWEETGSAKYRDIARNFWDIVTGHHVYVIGGVGNYEHFQQPDTVAAQLSNFTCENCVSYNMLKLTRLLHFHHLAAPTCSTTTSARCSTRCWGSRIRTRRTASTATTPACRPPRSSASRSTTSPRATRTSTPPTGTRSPATPPPGSRPRPSSPTPSTAATRTACPSTCTSRPR